VGDVGVGDVGREGTATTLATDVATPARGSGPSGDRVAAEHLLVIGWNTLGRQLVEQMAVTASPGSSLEIVYDPNLVDDEELDVTGSSSLTITTTTMRAMTWNSAETDMERLTSIVLLGYRAGLSRDEADSRTLLNLMLLRRDLAERGGVAPRIIVELLDVDSVELARTGGADDFVVSDAIASRLMTQLAEQPERRPVFLQLYTGEGPTLRMVDLEMLELESPVDFGTIVDAADDLGWLAIGWRTSVARGGEVVLNPSTTAQIDFAAGDQLVVVA
jgi:hypothetical protein